MREQTSVISSGLEMCPKKGLPWGLEMRRKRINLERRTLDGWDVGGKHQGFWAPKPEIVSVEHLQNDVAG